MSNTYDKDLNREIDKMFGKYQTTPRGLSSNDILTRYFDSEVQHQLNVGLSDKERIELSKSLRSMYRKMGNGVQIPQEIKPTRRLGESYYDYAERIDARDAASSSKRNLVSTGEKVSAQKTSVKPSNHYWKKLIPFSPLILVSPIFFTDKNNKKENKKTGLYT